MGRPQVTPTNAGHAYDDGTRRTEILQTAASLIATSGLRTSLQEIADAAGILPGSLYHHFESKEAILVELLRRYHADLDRIAEHALSKLDDPTIAVGLRPDRGSQLGDRAVRGDARRRAADDVLRGARARIAELTALAQQRPTAIMEAMVQTLRAARWSGYLQIRCRPPRAGRPPRPGDAAGRTRRHPVQRQRRQTGRAAVPDPAGGTWPACRPPTPELDRSAAFIAADDVVKSWSDDSGRRTRRQGRARPRRRPSRVRPQGLRSHDHQGHRVGGTTRHRHGVPVDRLEGPTAGVDHAIVRREGRRGMDARAALRFVADREAGRA